MDGTPLELFDRADNRTIWRAWIMQPDGLNLEQWAQSLDEPLREQTLRVLQLNIPEPQEYRYLNDILECARILQLDLARRWKDRITEQVDLSDDGIDRAAVIEQLVQIKAYIDAMSIPKRSPTYVDLHTLHTV